MTKTTNKRWVCPECLNGIHAPSRMRKVDTRRYCLRCSEKKGVLVERVSPALEKQREVARQRSIEKQATKRSKMSASKRAEKEKVKAREEVSPFDVRREVEILWRHFRKHDPGLPSWTPKVEITRARHGGWHGGGGWGRGGGMRIRISLTNDRRRMWTLLLHELAHCAVPPRNGDSHPKEMYLAMRAVIRSRLKLDISFYGQQGDRWGYHVDHLIDAQVQEFVDWCEGRTRKVYEPEPAKYQTCRKRPDAFVVQMIRPNSRWAVTLAKSKHGFLNWEQNPARPIGNRGWATRTPATLVYFPTREDALAAYEEEISGWDREEGVTSIIRTVAEYEAEQQPAERLAAHGT